MHTIVCLGVLGMLLSQAISAQQLQVAKRGGQTQLSVDIPGHGTKILHATDHEVIEPQIYAWDQVIAATWQQRGRQGEMEAWYRLSIDAGNTFGRARHTHFDLQLRYAAFDPLEGEPQVLNNLQAQSNHELFIVQYVTQGTEEWRDAIRALGATDHRFLAMHANIWHMDSATAEIVADLPFVRWVGPFHPVYKLENELLDAYYAGTLETRSYNIVVGEWGPRQKQVVAERVRSLGGTVERNNEQGWIVQAYLTPNQLMDVVHQSEVLGVDRKGDPQRDMDKVRRKMGGDFLHGLGFDGTGVRAEVMDDGLGMNNPAWKYPPIVHGNVSGGFHGTSTYSINFSSNADSTRGLCPDAQGIIADYSTFGNRYTHTAELLSPPYEAVYQSNSWGDPRTRNYTSVSQEMDDIIFINDMVITQSQSNAGNQDSRPQAWAKNIVAVGGIKHYDDLDDSNDDWTSGASTGPAEDGRVKPDLSAYYDDVETVNWPGGFSGTSAASPIVAGHFGLFHELWHNGIFGNSTGSSVFDSRPHSTLARAMLINSAWQWPDNQTDITRFRQGWGRPDMRTLWNNTDTMFWVNETDVLQNLQSQSYTLPLGSDATEFRATLVYIDRAGTTSSTLHRINDLSMRVTDPGGTQYWGNNGLTTGSYNWSSSGGSSNTIDVVENVFVQNPQPGNWTIEVFADEVNQDTHSETGAVDADYALVVTGVEPFNCGDAITFSGPSTANVNDTLTYTYANAPANRTFSVLYSPNLEGSSVAGACLEIGPLLKTAGTGTTSVTGNGSWTSGPVPPQGAGLTIYVEFLVDDNGTWVDSNYLQLDIN